MRKMLFPKIGKLPKFVERDPPQLGNWEEFLFLLIIKIYVSLYRIDSPKFGWLYLFWESDIIKIKKIPGIKEFWEF